jgi:hypothetical protein
VALHVDELGAEDVGDALDGGRALNGEEDGTRLDVGDYLTP